MRQIFKSPFLTNLLVLVLFLALFGLHFLFPFLEPFEWKVLDMRFQIRGTVEFDPKVAMVAIDEKSLEALGAWPWPRSYMADVVQALGRKGAALVGFDILFAEGERKLGQQVFADLLKEYRELGIDALNMNAKVFSQNLIDLQEGLGNDQIFAAAIKESGNVVLPYFFGLGGNGSAEKHTQNGRLLADLQLPSFKDLITNPEDAEYFPFLKAREMTLPIEPLATAALSVAHVNTFPDRDGNLRWENLLIEYENEVYPSFSLLMATFALGVESIGVVLGDGIHLDNTHVPMDGKGRGLINYLGPNPFPYYSFVDVVQGKAPKGALEGKVVLIGANATGLHDNYATPFSPAMPGVEKHATMIQNILDANFISRSGWTNMINFGLLAGMGLFLAWLLPKMNAWAMVGLVLVFQAAYFFLVQYLFEAQKIWVDAIFPLMEQGGLLLATLLSQYASERKQKQFIRGAFGQYLSPAVIKRLEENAGLLELGGEQKQMTAFFSDIAGFSTISEKLTPHELVELLNEYLTAMTDIILRHEGTIDKYEGDAIIAFWGAPIQRPDHALQACLAALEMQETLTRLRAEWKERGKSELHVRMGINTGEMVVGNMGSKHRMDYTIMGDAVNLAARLEGVNKIYGTVVMISQYTYQVVGDRLECRELDLIRVMGKTQPVAIYEVLAKKGELDADVSAATISFEEGLSLYREQKWEAASERFQNVLKLKPGDDASEVFIERCQDFRDTSQPGRRSNDKSKQLPKDWDGVFQMTDK